MDNMSEVTPKGEGEGEGAHGGEGCRGGTLTSEG